jgi:hypothetical protein
MRKNIFFFLQREHNRKEAEGEGENTNTRKENEMVLVPWTEVCETTEEEEEDGRSD